MKKTNILPRHPFSLLLCLFAALLAWIIFYPSVFSRDSFYMLLDAVNRTFSDMHPLLIPLTLSLILKVGGNIGLVTLAQLLLGLLGIRRLIIAMIESFGIGEARLTDRIALIILILLATPLTPLLIYLATIWSDTWIAIFLLWIIALLLELNQNMKDQRRAWYKIALVIVLISLLILVRYNAIVIYPFLILALDAILRRNRYRNIQRIGLAVAPLFLAASFLVIQYRVHRIEEQHPERAVYALDLASMIEYDPSICHDLVFESCDQVLQFSPQFRVGNGAIDLAFNQGNEYLYDPFLQLFFYPGLEKEFRIAVVDHPLLFLTVKFLNYIDFAGPHPTQYYFQRSIPSKDQVQMPNQAFASPNNWWFTDTREILYQPVLRWFSFVHVVWLVTNILSLLVCTWLAIHFHSNRAAFLGLVLLMPASYYASYLIALTTSEFRFMYPSTLVMQVITLTFLFSIVAKRLRRARRLAV